MRKFGKFNRSFKCPKKYCLKTRKVRYRDHQEAVKALNSVRNKAKRQMDEHGSTDHEEKRIYQCEHCKGFHLTKTEFRI